jgi:hypothetical protein
MESYVFIMSHLNVIIQFLNTINQHMLFKVINVSKVYTLIPYISCMQACFLIVLKIYIKNTIFVGITYMICKSQYFIIVLNSIICDAIGF